MCRKYNLKISRQKFDLATKLSFAGFMIDASSGEVIVSLDPARLEEKQLMDIPRNKMQVPVLSSVYSLVQKYGYQV